jgi:hypothetical protein
MKSSRDHLKVRARGRALEVARRGFDEGVTRPPSQHAQADPIGALALGTVQHLDDHGSPSFALVILSGYEGSRSAGLKHLR